MLAARLAKRIRHLVRKRGSGALTCVRLYERDIPDYPAIIDWYADEGSAEPAREGDAVAWLFDRTKDDTLEQQESHRRDTISEILNGLQILESRLHVKHRGRQRSDEGGRSQYERVADRGHTKIVLEHGLRFEINLSDYLDVGLFLDHRSLRHSVAQRANGKRMLNLFAYTGAFSVHARAGGAATTTTVDLSRTYLDWYERNLQLNGLTCDSDHQVIQADCLEWLKAGPESSDDLFDLVICDPPTFSNSKRMATDSFAVARDHADLLQCVARFVAPGGEIFFSTNARRFNLDEAAVPAGFGCQEISHRTVPEDFRNRRIHRCWRLAQGWRDRNEARGTNQSEASGPA